MTCSYSLETICWENEFLRRTQMLHNYVGPTAALPIRVICKFQEFKPLFCRCLVCHIFPSKAVDDEFQDAWFFWMFFGSPDRWRSVHVKYRPISIEKPKFHGLFLPNEERTVGRYNISLDCPKASFWTLQRLYSNAFHWKMLTMTETCLSLCQICDS